MDTRKHSKRLAYVLRHAPDAVGLTLGDGGWVSIRDLLAGFARKGWTLTRQQLDHVVATNDKQRFTVSADGLRIRAAQGHSVAFASDLVPVSPPALLYHGTATRFLDDIWTRGVQPMSRQHVHLSVDIATATRVGQRHGKPVILAVAAERMAEDGLLFYRADDGVWLTASVAPAYLSIAD